MDPSVIEQDEQWARWQRKHRQAAPDEPLELDPFVEEVFHQRKPASSNRALDLACGRGRHALALAKLGWSVEAWDFSSEGLARLKQRAAEQDLEIKCRLVDLRQADLSAFWAQFHFVVQVNYLNRDLLASAHKLLLPEGLFLFQGFNEDWPEERPGPRFRLRAGELESGLPGLRTLKILERDGRSFFLGQRSDA
ncbi:MAG: methyltransferase domain-containing protein [Planctomycetota bacterium]|nr:MAG: methyltransferase domain-containing protein [Planctomycetota bacterium]